MGKSQILDLVVWGSDPIGAGLCSRARHINSVVPSLDGTKEAVISK